MLKVHMLLNTTKDKIIALINRNYHQFYVTIAKTLQMLILSSIPDEYRGAYSVPPSLPPRAYPKFSSNQKVN